MQRQTKRVFISHNSDVSCLVFWQVLFRKEAFSFLAFMCRQKQWVVNLDLGWPSYIFAFTLVLQIWLNFIQFSPQGWGAYLNSVLATVQMHLIHTSVSLQFNFPKEPLFRVGVVPKPKQMLCYISMCMCKTPFFMQNFSKKISKNAWQMKKRIVRPKSIKSGIKIARIPFV